MALEWAANQYRQLRTPEGDTAANVLDAVRQSVGDVPLPPLPQASAVLSPTVLSERRVEPITEEQTLLQHAAHVAEYLIMSQIYPHDQEAVNLKTSWRYRIPGDPKGGQIQLTKPNEQTWEEAVNSFTSGGNPEYAQKLQDLERVVKGVTFASLKALDKRSTPFVGGFTNVDGSRLLVMMVNKATHTRPDLYAQELREALTRYYSITNAQPYLGIIEIAQAYIDGALPPIQ